MWTKSPLLKKFEKLKELGFPLAREAGSKISRGYADLGYEEFLLLSEDKMISLFSGKVSVLPEEHVGFFFTVPSIDDMVNAVTMLGYDIKGLDYVDLRTWKLNVVHKNEEMIFTGRTIEEVLTETLLSLFKPRGEDRA